MPRLNTRTITSARNKALIDRIIPVKCPFCNNIFDNGRILKRHVKICK